jgi:hypothetical protein
MEQNFSVCVSNITTEFPSPALTFLPDDGVKLGVWSALEPGLGIIASSLATTRPLFRRITHSVHGSGINTLDDSRTYSGIKSKMIISMKSDDFVIEGPTVGESQDQQDQQDYGLEQRPESPRDLESQLLPAHGPHEEPQQTSEQPWQSLRPSLEQQPTSPANLERQSWSDIGLQARQQQMMAMTRQLYIQSLEPRLVPPADFRSRPPSSRLPQTSEQPVIATPSSAIVINDELPLETLTRKRFSESSETTAEVLRRATERRRLAAESKRWAARKSSVAGKVKEREMTVNPISKPSEKGKRRSVRFSFPGRNEASRNPGSPGVRSEARSEARSESNNR